MTRRTLRALLDGLEDLSEFVLGSPADLLEEGAEWSLPAVDPLRAAWLLAEADATSAWRQWRMTRDEKAYVAYRAAADRAGAAQDALALRASRRI